MFLFRVPPRGEAAGAGGEAQVRARARGTGCAGGTRKWGGHVAVLLPVPSKKEGQHLLWGWRNCTSN